MITFKSLLESVYSDLSPSERELVFLLKHIVKKRDYPVDAENQFTANNIEKDRSKRASYEDGEDELVYESINEDIVKTNRADKKAVIAHTIDPKTGKSKVFVRRTAAGEIKVGRPSAELQEVFKPGKLSLNDGSNVVISSNDSISLNSLFDTLNSSNQIKMKQRLMADKTSFNEILSFSKETV